MKYIKLIKNPIRILILNIAEFILADKESFID